MSGPFTGARGFVEDVARWREATAGRAPAYHRLLGELVRLLEEGGPEGEAVADRLGAAWGPRVFRAFYDRPLLLLAALRMDALAEGPRHPLWAAVAAPAPDPDRATRGALLEALSRDRVWACARTRFVQTNETSRAVAWLWPAEIAGCGRGARPLALVEVGAAAGLNLVADRLPAPWTRPSGEALRTVGHPRVVARLGIDANPLDPRDEGDANWLRACVWAGETARIERLEAAIAAFRASPATVERGDVTRAPERLRSLEAGGPDRAVVLAFPTIVRDYLGEPTRTAYERGMRRWLAEAPAGAAVWVELEINLDDPEKRATIVAHVRDGGGAVDLPLGVTGYHPTTVAVDEAAVARLARIVR